MLNLSPKELKLIVKNNDIKGYKIMSKDKLLSIINVPEPVKNKTVKDIRKKNSHAEKIFRDIEPIKENKTIKDIKKENSEAEKILTDIRTLFVPEEDYYKPIKIVNAIYDHYIEYESNVDKHKTLTVKKYLNQTKPYLDDLINGHKTQGEWKIQLSMSINFLSSKDSNETHTMHTKVNNIEIMIMKQMKLLKNCLNLFYKDI